MENGVSKCCMARMVRGTQCRHKHVVIVAAAKFLRHISFFSSTVPREAVLGMVSYRTVTEHNVPARKLVVGDWDRCSLHTIQSFPACFARGILMFLVHVEENFDLQRAQPTTLLSGAPQTCTFSHVHVATTHVVPYIRGAAESATSLSMRPLHSSNLFLDSNFTIQLSCYTSEVSCSEPKPLEAISVDINCAPECA